MKSFREEKKIEKWQTKRLTSGLFAEAVQIEKIRGLVSCDGEA